MHLIHQQEIWMPTLQGWLVSLGCAVGLITFFVIKIYSFLAVNLPINADVLVLEGWIQDPDIEKAIAEFERGGYQKLMTIGPPLSEGHYLCQYKSFAELAAATLLALGFDSDKIVTVQTPNVLINRTNTSAVALREWIANSELKIESINLYTFDVHSRRNWQSFKQTLAPNIKVGVIVLEPRSYEPRKWWMYSAGVKAIISETIAYIYARLVGWSA
jgi:hypothetical protein